MGVLGEHHLGLPLIHRGVIAKAFAAYTPHPSPSAIDGHRHPHCYLISESGFVHPHSWF